MTRIVLASQSKARGHLLRGAGLDFDASPAFVDEDAVKDAMLLDRAPFANIAGHLAELKALKVSARYPEAFVIGADQVLVFDGTVVSKSEDLSSARTLLRRLRGHVHELVTACVVARDGAIVWRCIETVVLRMRDFSDAFLETYLAAEGTNVLDAVGCYRLEGIGIQLFSEIRGDYFAILGLPLLALLAALRAQGAVAS